MAAAGDRRAELAGAERDLLVAELHREHYPSLVRLACLLLDDRGAGEEVVQEAFVRVYLAWARVDRPLTYLRSTVMNLARSRMRRRLVARRRVEPVSTAALSAEEHLVLLDDQQEVLAAVARSRGASASAWCCATTSTSPRRRSRRRSASPTDR